MAKQDKKKEAGPKPMPGMERLNLRVFVDDQSPDVATEQAGYHSSPGHGRADGME